MKERLDVIIVPTKSVMIALPATMVRQILPYAPIIPEESSPRYLRGTLIVQQNKLHVVDFNVIAEGKEATLNGGEKLIWVLPLHADIAKGYVFQASRSPYFVSCSRADIVEVSKGDHPLIACYIKVNGFNNTEERPILIPDLSQLENDLKG